MSESNAADMDLSGPALVQTTINQYKNAHPTSSLAQCNVVIKTLVSTCILGPCSQLSSTTLTNDGEQQIKGVLELLSWCCFENTSNAAAAREDGAKPWAVFYTAYATVFDPDAGDDVDGGDLFEGEGTAAEGEERVKLTLQSWLVPSLISSQSHLKLHQDSSPRARELECLMGEVVIKIMTILPPQPTGEDKPGSESNVSTGISRLIKTLSETRPRMLRLFPLPTAKQDRFDLDPFAHRPSPFAVTYAIPNSASHRALFTCLLESALLYSTQHGLAPPPTFAFHQFFSTFPASSSAPEREWYLRIATRLLSHPSLDKFTRRSLWVVVVRTLRLRLSERMDETAAVDEDIEDQANWEEKRHKALRAKEEDALLRAVFSAASSSGEDGLGDDEESNTAQELFPLVKQMIEFIPSRAGGDLQATSIYALKMLKTSPLLSASPSTSTSPSQSEKLLSKLEKHTLSIPLLQILFPPLLPLVTNETTNTGAVSLTQVPNGSGGNPTHVSTVALGKRKRESQTYGVDVLSMRRALLAKVAGRFGSTEKRSERLDIDALEVKNPSRENLSRVEAETEWAGWVVEWVVSKISISDLSEDTLKTATSILKDTIKSLVAHLQSFQSDITTISNTRTLSAKVLKCISKLVVTLTPSTTSRIQFELITLLAETINFSALKAAIIDLGSCGGKEKIQSDMIDLTVDDDDEDVAMKDPPDHGREEYDMASSIIKLVTRSLLSPSRDVRIAAGSVVISLIKAHQTHLISTYGPNYPVYPIIEPLYKVLEMVLETGRSSAKETALMTVAALGRAVGLEGDLMSRIVIVVLLKQLGGTDGFFKGLAYTMFVTISKFYDKTPQKFLSPYNVDISRYLVTTLVTSPGTIVDFTTLIGVSATSYLILNLQHIVPFLVVNGNLEGLKKIARYINKPVPTILMDEAVDILAELLMRPRMETEKGLAFCMSVFDAKENGNAPVTLIQYVKTAGLLLLMKIVMQLGDEDKAIQRNATEALKKLIERAQGKSQKAAKRLKSEEPITTEQIGAYVQGHMLGIISTTNDILHDHQGKKSVEEKQKIIRSLGALISMVGNSMGTYSPQIMATLQSTLNMEPLRLVTLQTWKNFVTTLKFKDISPFIGPTTAAFVTAWPTFTIVEKEVATSTIEYIISDNLDQLKEVADGIVSLDGIQELKAASEKLKHQRADWDFQTRVDRLLPRVSSENTAVSVLSLKELRSLLTSKSDELQKLSSGYVFDPLIARTLRVLMANVSRDGEFNDELRDVSYDCIGILGALDPDRVDLGIEEYTFLGQENLASLEEATRFSIHLIRDLLVGAYRSTNDTNYQQSLAFAVQEILKFCGFTEDILNNDPRSAIPITTRNHWNKLPKHVLETITPLLASHFTIKPPVLKVFTYPIYSNAPTYREWVQRWTTDLINKIPEGNAQTIFGVFRPIATYQDVHVSRRILPHLVLNAITTGDSKVGREIALEIRTVLEDQVAPQGNFAADKRLLSAQTVFELMDHLSRWIRYQRTAISDHRPNRDQGRARDTPITPEQLSKVESVMKITDENRELTARAALHCKAYARSLLNFEQRIVDVRAKEQIEDRDLQPYYEHLHKIYAELDEPDGMEGVSTKVIAPSLEHQIREHESTGRWTSAQSCWEVKIQDNPNEFDLHLGLLRCLRNLGHYDTLRTHIRGLVTRQPAWNDRLSSFQVEAAWIVGDWDAVRSMASSNHTPSPEITLASVLLAVRDGDHAKTALSLKIARQELGAPLRSVGSNPFRRAYDSVVHLHLLHELEMVAKNAHDVSRLSGPNRRQVTAKSMRDLKALFDGRLDRTLPSFRAREPILSLRRTAFGLSKTNTDFFRKEIGRAWLLSSKIARKAGHTQTAYSAILQAKNAGDRSAFVQGSKLLYTGGQTLRALQELENMLAPEIDRYYALKESHNEDPEESLAETQRRVAKACLVRARWVHEAERYAPNVVISRFGEAITLAGDWENPQYQLGHFYDLELADLDKIAKDENDTFQAATYMAKVCEHYSAALLHGTKYIFQTMPRMLTIWLDFGADPEMIKIDHSKLAKKDTGATPHLSATYQQMRAIKKHVRKCIDGLPAYAWLTAFPQVVSRIGHENNNLYEMLSSIIEKVLSAYPHQAVWSMVSVSQSNKPDRARRCKDIFHKVQTERNVYHKLNTSKIIRQAIRMTEELLILANRKLNDRDPPKTLSMKREFPSLIEATRDCELILPLQEQLTVTLPSASFGSTTNHNPFPNTLIKFSSWVDKIDVMSSLQRPRKICVKADNGREYNFLCKPHDDLRKDARLMDFNDMINKLLRSDIESRKRNLYIRTYAVVPLNEECGLIQWVENTTLFRGILQKYYGRRSIKLYSGEVAEIYEKMKSIKKPERVGEYFTSHLLKMYPPIFHEWFLETFPEPSTWLACRSAYGRTYAVMSMVGFVLGLGDRHCENTLYDANTGDTVHVDLNCIFEKGRSLETPERVAFRLTQNIVDGFGVTGVEGIYRNACEVTMRILRENKDSLMSVLEAFVHDPLVEWEQKSYKTERSKSSKSTRPVVHDIRKLADESLRPIERKLRGVQADYIQPGVKGPVKEYSISNQVEALIQEATNPSNLGRMYVGWSAYL